MSDNDVEVILSEYIKKYISDGFSKEEAKFMAIADIFYTYERMWS